MFSRKRVPPTTVAGAMAVFQTVVSDLAQIAEDNMALTIVLEEQKTAITEKIEIADTEVAQAKSITAKLQNLWGIS